MEVYVCMYNVHSKNEYEVFFTKSISENYNFKYMSETYHCLISS